MSHNYGSNRGRKFESALPHAARSADSEISRPIASWIQYSTQTNSVQTQTKTPRRVQTWTNVFYGALRSELIGRYPSPWAGCSSLSFYFLKFEKEDDVEYVPDSGKDMQCRTQEVIKVIRTLYLRPPLIRAAVSPYSKPTNKIGVLFVKLLV